MWMAVGVGAISTHEDASSLYVDFCQLSSVMARLSGVLGDAVDEVARGPGLQGDLLHAVEDESVLGQLCDGIDEFAAMGRVQLCCVEGGYGPVRVVQPVASLRLCGSAAATVTTGPDRTGPHRWSVTSCRP